MTYGDECVSEMKKYKFYAKGDDVKCRNRLDTCERSLCECDKLMAEEHSSTAETWDQKVCIYHWIASLLKLLSVSPILGRLASRRSMYPCSSCKHWTYKRTGVLQWTQKRSSIFIIQCKQTRMLLKWRHCKCRRMLIDKVKTIFILQIINSMKSLPLKCKLL